MPRQEKEIIHIDLPKKWYHCPALPSQRLPFPPCKKNLPKMSFLGASKVFFLIGETYISSNSLLISPVPSKELLFYPFYSSWAHQIFWSHNKYRKDFFGILPCSFHCMYQLPVSAYPCKFYIRFPNGRHLAKSVTAARFVSKMIIFQVLWKRHDTVVDLQDRPL